VIKAEDFGIVGDGGTDNTAALMAIRDQIRAGTDRVWHVDFETGHYCYGDNRWALFGDRTVILDFNNSTVECFADAILPLGIGPLVWKPEYPAAQNVDIFIPGDLIESVNAVARRGFVQTDVVRLQDKIAGQYQPRDRVLVAGYIQQTTEDGAEGWGWPPNFRYFEWKRVAEIVDVNTLRFEDPFRFDYHASWPDLHHSFGGLSYGAPRIWRCRLDDGRQTNRSLAIRNANFVGGRNRPAGTWTPISPRGWHITLENCSGTTDTVCWPSEAKRNEFVNCRFSCREVEMDKIVESVLFDRCEVRSRMFSAGGAVLDVRLHDCNFYDFVQVTPRRSWQQTGCQFYNGLHFSAGVTNTPFTVDGSASHLR
jgi:hypothetical protein